MMTNVRTDWSLDDADNIDRLSSACCFDNLSSDATSELAVTPTSNSSNLWANQRDYSVQETMQLYDIHSPHCSSTAVLQRRTSTP